jgi:putative ABC transport system permease protein
LITSIKARWAGFGAEEPFSYQFMDDLYNKTYASDRRTEKLLNIFAILTIVVACMGLFGLATYASEQRAKEIGIRKVLGASAMQVTGMLSKDFLKLVLIACVIAFPFSYWIMEKWLQDFAYRTNFAWWTFLIAAGAALITAFVTVSAKTIRAALNNPVKNLRAE